MGLSSPIKRILPRTLLGRAVLIIVSPLILLQIISTVVFYDRHWETVTRRLVGSFVGELTAVMRLLDENPSPEGQARVLLLARENLDIQAAVQPGAILSNGETTPDAQGILETALDHALSDRLRRPFLIDARSYDRQIEVKVQLPDGVLQIFVPRKRLSSQTTYIFVMWMVGSSLVLFSVATLFMRNQVRPIRRLAVAAEDFGKGRNHPEFKPAGALEVRQAAAAFIDMRDRIRRQIEQRTAMLSGVSHDLRTPLTRMRLQLAMLPEDEGTRELRDDVLEMEKMIEGYLAFARGEDGERTRDADLGAVLREIAEATRRHGARVELETQGDLSLALRPMAVKRALTNLVANAVRYGSKVRVAAERNGDSIEITVDDDGPGIPPGERAEVFRPFYRLDSSRNPETGGVGLGLSIAQDVVRGHGGEIVLSDSPDGGLRATVRLPL